MNYLPILFLLILVWVVFVILTRNKKNLPTKRPEHRTMDPGLDAILAECGAEEAVETIRPLLLPMIAVDYEKAETTSLPPSASRLGGRPCLPPGVEWPRNPEGIPIPFVGQINLAEASKVDSTGLLPKSGLLSFFYDQKAWGFAPEDRNRIRVLYTEDSADVREIVDGPAPETSFKLASVTFRAATSYPSYEKVSERKILSDEAFEAWCDADVPLAENHLLGNPDCVQGDDMESECQFASSGVSEDEITTLAPARRAELESGASDWILLFQVGDNNDLDMLWGDAGRIFFWIRKQDLAARAFDRVWAVLQCG